MKKTFTSTVAILTIAFTILFSATPAFAAKAAKTTLEGNSLTVPFTCGTDKDDIPTSMAEAVQTLVNQAAVSGISLWTYDADEVTPEEIYGQFLFCTRPDEPAQKMSVIQTDNKVLFQIERPNNNFFVYHFPDYEYKESDSIDHTITDGNYSYSLFTGSDGKVHISKFWVIDARHLPATEENSKLISGMLTMEYKELRLIKTPGSVELHMIPNREDNKSTVCFDFPMIGTEFDSDATVVKSNLVVANDGIYDIVINNDRFELRPKK